MRTKLSSKHWTFLLHDLLFAFKMNRKCSRRTHLEHLKYRLLAGAADLQELHSASAAFLSCQPPSQLSLTSTIPSDATVSETLHSCSLTHLYISCELRSTDSDVVDSWRLRRRMVWFYQFDGGRSFRHPCRVDCKQRLESKRNYAIRLDWAAPLHQGLWPSEDVPFWYEFHTFKRYKCSSRVNFASSVIIAF